MKNQNQLNQERADYGVEQLLRVIKRTPDRVCLRVEQQVSAQSKQLAADFYRVMMQDHEAVKYLSHEIVTNHLNHSMKMWLEQLFCIHGEQDMHAVVARQFHVGAVHARLQIPINLVAQGARYLNRWLIEADYGEEFDRREFASACSYITELLDLAIELMSLAFVDSSERSVRVDETYRINALGHNIGMERERQKSALLEWGQRIAFTIHRGERAEITPLGDSEFGLWLFHKAEALFNESSEISGIITGVKHIDHIVIPQLLPKQFSDATALQRSLTVLQKELENIKYLINTLFDRYIEVETGRDALTRLLNRRFMPPVLNREIDLARRNASQFSVLLLDVDHFKNINDTYGHDAGDIALQQVASSITNGVRGGDFVFRYGGEEVLVVLVEVNAKQAMSLAEKMRTRIASTELMLPHDTRVQLTVSIGVAMFDGHPDYEYLINRADGALYEAKRGGRNRCVLAEGGC